MLSVITDVLAHLQLPPEQVALISGIGCSSRIPTYTNVYGFNGVHGRALPLACGLKLSFFTAASIQFMDEFGHVRRARRRT